MRQRLMQIREILDHPANRANRFAAFARYVKWNVGRRLLDRADYVIDIAPRARVVLSNRENYATLAYTCGLYDHDEMHFLAHYLGAGDVFGDFGANVGVYSVFAGSLGARVLAVEPVPDTFRRLQGNLRLNDTPGCAMQVGLSNESGTLLFTDTLSGLNHVARPGERGAVEVEVVTGDALVTASGLAPTVLKIDVEGFEVPVLQGCGALLASLVAVIIELNGSGRRYGFQDEAVDLLLTSAGFVPVDYEPHSRTIRLRSSPHRDRFNTLYLKRDRVDDVRARVVGGSSGDRSSSEDRVAGLGPATRA